MPTTRQAAATTQAAAMPATSLEGRLLAHRRILALLLGQLPKDQKQALLLWLSDRSILQDGQEDPGAVPAAEHAIGFALADEFRCLQRLIEDGVPDIGPSGIEPTDIGPPDIGSMAPPSDGQR